MKKLLIFGIIGLTFASAFAGPTCPRCKKSGGYLLNCDKCHTTCCTKCGGSTEREMQRGSVFSTNAGNECKICDKGKLQYIK